LVSRYVHEWRCIRQFEVAAAKEQPMKVKLKVLRGKSAGKEIVIPAPRFLIGRSSDCHLRPKSESISRNHCTILVRDDRVWIRDLNSRNGTFVNGERVTEEEEIKDGDQLQIGKLEFTVVVTPAVHKEEKPEAIAGHESHVETKLHTGGEEPDSLDFDVSEWLQEAETKNKVQPAAPETRQFQLDETDQLKLSAMAKAEDGEPVDEQSRKPEKKKPGKLPPRPAKMTGSSRDAAADMLKKFFNSR
jgi:pSer/pThr/pTyr-binding forkhead associated (FHA) protein